MHRDRRAAQDRDRHPGRRPRHVPDHRCGPAAPPRSRSPSASRSVLASERPAQRARAIGTSGAFGAQRVPPTCATIPPVNPLDLVAIVLVVLAVLLGFRSGALPQVGGLLGAIGGGAIVVLCPAPPRRAARQRPARLAAVRRADRPPPRGRDRRIARVDDRPRDRAGPGDRGPERGRPRRGRVHRRRPGTAHRLARRRPPGDRPDPAPDRGRPDLHRDPDAQRRPAATRRDRDGARVAPGRVRPARGLRRPGAAAPARRSTHPPTRRPGRSPSSPRRARSGSRPRRADSSPRGAASSSPTGYVVTNAHVVAGARSRGVRVTGIAGQVDAIVVLFDPALDVAVLHAPDLQAAPLRFAATDPDSWRGRRGARVSGRWQPHDRAGRRDRRLRGDRPGHLRRGDRDPASPRAPRADRPRRQRRTRSCSRTGRSAA